jgi:uncharacterized membrane protein
MNRDWYLLIGALGGYLLLMFTNPVRASLRDGIRVLQRYHAVWAIPAGLGLCYALFHLALRVFWWMILPSEQKPIFQWQTAWYLPPPAYDWSEVHDFDAFVLFLRSNPRFVIFESSLLPSLENLAGIFNNLVTTYPASAVAALLLLANYDGHHTVLRQSLARRFKALGWVIYGAISLCAIAAILKPLMYATLPWLGNFLPGLFLLRVSTIADWLSFLFEYLLGACIQVYLILMVYAWVRGTAFRKAQLLDFAIRRLSYVMKWAGIVVLLSTLFIHLPLIAIYFPPLSHIVPSDSVISFIDRVSRPIMAVVLIVFASVQITLTFHSESLIKAVRDHVRFALRNFWSLGWFLAIATLHFLLLDALNMTLISGLPEGSPGVIAWQLAFPLLGGLLAGWLLAAWVCEFKRCEAGQTRVDNWIRF